MADWGFVTGEKLFEGPFAAAYSFCMEREAFGRTIAKVVWRSDIGPYYAALRELGGEADGTTIIDAPCGSGIAFRHLRPEQRVRYLAVDLSAAMLDRARRKVTELGLDQIELMRADATELPIGDGVADLFLSWWGLHCFERPADAVREASRCLKPGGRLVGGTFVKGERPADRLLVRPNTGAFGPVGTPQDLRGWLEDAGLDRIGLDVSGVFAYFRGLKA